MKTKIKINKNNKIKELTLTDNYILFSNKKTSIPINKIYSSENISKNKNMKNSKSVTILNNAKKIKNKTERKLTATLSRAQIYDIKEDIYAVYMMVKDNKFRSIKAEKNKSSPKVYLKKNNISENKYEIYDLDKLSYQIYHDYQKINFNDTSNFLDRMELYNIKRCLKDIKIKEYLNIKSPKISELKRQKIFDNLINDVKIRKNKRELNCNINKMSKKLNQKKIDEIVTRLYTNEKNNKKKLKVKIEDKEKQKLIENLKGNKKKNYNNKKEITKCNSQDTINNKIYELNKRLYYREINKKDIQYKLFLQKLDDLFGNHLNNKNKENGLIKNENFSSNQINNNGNKDYLDYSQLINLRKNNNNKIINLQRKINLKERNIVKYNFRDDNTLNNNSNKDNVTINSFIKSFHLNKNLNNKPEANDKIQNGNNIYNIRKDSKNYSFSNQKDINNLKISLLIDNFFCNKK